MSLAPNDPFNMPKRVGIPDDVIDAILRYCSVPDLLRLLRVSRSTQSYVMKHIQRCKVGIPRAPRVVRQLSRLFRRRQAERPTENRKAALEGCLVAYLDLRPLKSTVAEKQLVNLLKTNPFLTGEDGSKKAFWKCFDEIDKICGQCCTKYGVKPCGWTTNEIQDYLESEVVGFSVLQGSHGEMAMPCVGYRSVPPKVRAFLKLAVAEARQGRLLFTLDSTVALAHTAHWDMEGLLPWIPMKDRHQSVKDYATVLATLNEIEGNVNPAKCPLQHVKERWKAKSFPATMEYAIFCMGGEARVLLTLEAHGLTPLVFVSAHYGACLPQDQRATRGHFLIEDLDKDPLDGEATKTDDEGLTAQVKPNTVTVSLKEVLKLETEGGMEELFPDLWLTLDEEEYSPCVNPDFWRAVGKILGQGSTTLNFDQIFEVEDANASQSMKIYEIAKREGISDSLPQGAFDLHLSIRAEDYSMHIALRPWADREPGYVSSHVGLPTSYFWYQIYFSRKSGSFALGPKIDKDKGPTMFGKSKVNALICWKWLQAHKDCEWVYAQGIEFLRNRIDKLNHSASGHGEELKFIAKTHGPSKKK